MIGLAGQPGNKSIKAVFIIHGVAEPCFGMNMANERLHELCEIDKWKL